MTLCQLFPGMSGGGAVIDRARANAIGKLLAQYLLVASPSEEAVDAELFRKFVALTMSELSGDLSTDNAWFVSMKDAGTFRAVSNFEFVNGAAKTVVPDAVLVDAFVASSTGHIYKQTEATGSFASFCNASVVDNGEYPVYGLAVNSDDYLIINQYLTTLKKTPTAGGAGLSSAVSTGYNTQASVGYDPYGHNLYLCWQNGGIRGFMAGSTSSSIDIYITPNRQWTGCAYKPNGVMYFCNYNGEVWARTADGAMSLLSSTTEHAWSGIAYVAGRLVTCGGGNIWNIDMTTGDITLIVAIGYSINDLAAVNNDLYMACGTSGVLKMVDGVGAPTAVSGLPAQNWTSIGAKYNASLSSDCALESVSHTLPVTASSGRLMFTGSNLADAGAGFPIGDEVNLYISGDGGTTWSEAVPATKFLDITASQAAFHTDILDFTGYTAVAFKFEGSGTRVEIDDLVIVWG